jgi:M6 family metalloprotease-like protein
MSIRFIRQAFTFTQPDGSTIELLGTGDQYQAQFETPDGRPVVRNPATGYYEVVTTAAMPAGAPPHAAAPQASPPHAAPPAATSTSVSPLQPGTRRWEQRREEKRQQLRAMRAMAAAGGPLLAPPQRQTVGDFIGLCLLIDFSDAPATIQREEVERFCNQPGYNGFGNSGSVFDYFNDNSIGRCRYTSIVAPYYRAQKPKTYYTDRTIPQPQRAYELMNEAIAFHRANGFDFSALTADNQGFVFAMNVYYAGPVTNNWAEGLWPHAYHLGSAVALSPNQKLYDYQFTAMGSELTLGTFCHENGHMLCDYPDLYDYGYESSGVGAYCLMCAGGNISPKNPVQISAYLKRLSGWARSQTALEHGRQVTLAAGSNDFALFSRGGREYFLIENRQKSGRDFALPDEGLAIWHVDEDGDNSNEQMTAASHYELSLMQADGLFQLERDGRNLGDSGDLYAGAAARFSDDTTPSSKWWNGTASNLTIDQIAAAGASVTFRCLLADTVAPAGIDDTISVAEAVTISSLKVGVDISHTYRGDLRVALTAPGGTVIELHPKGRGGNADDLRITYDETNLPALATLRGRSTQGDWRLTVQDLAPSDAGRLNGWSLAFTAAPATTAPIELHEALGTPIPDFPSPGIERSLSVAGTARVGSVEVSLDISHTWIGDLRVSLVSPAGTEVMLHDGAGGDADTLVRTFTAATTPALSALEGQAAAGAWRLKIVDRVAQDAGKLNSWRVLIKPETA